jgi:hypothetical protein
MKVGEWDVDDTTGLMSLEGKTTFPVYGMDGHVTTQTCQYFYHDGTVQVRVSRDLSLFELERLYKLEGTDATQKDS